MQILKQSTAVTLKIGPFLDDSDGKTAETGLTIAQADVRLSKNGGNIAQKNDATACTHDELGIYGCPMNTTDTGTLGRLQLWVHESGALPVFHEYMIVPANVWDSLFGSDKLQVDIAEISSDVSAANNLELALENGVAGYVASDCKKYNGKTTTTSTGNKPDVNVDEISDDTTAPANLELMYDGTGYAGGTTKLKVDVDKIAGNDSVPTNLRSNYKGTDWNKHVWHVAKTGNNGFGGHAFADAKLTIAVAVTAAADGDTILVWQGTYDETVDLDTANKGLKIIGMGSGLTKISVTSGQPIELESNTSLRNLYIKTTASGQKGINGISKTNIRIENCYIEGVLDGCCLNACENTIIRDCHFVGGAEGLCVTNDSFGSLVENCLIEGTGANNAALTSSLQANSTSGNNGVTIRNCTLRATRSGGTLSTHYAGALRCNSRGVTLDNCTLIAEATGSSQGDAYGVYSESITHQGKPILIGCSVYTSSANGTAYDLNAATNCKVLIADSFYDTAKTNGTIVEGSSGWAAAVNAEVDTALDTAIPGSPTADSINERVKAMDDALPDAQKG